MSDHPSLREFVEVMIARDNLRRDDLRREDKQQVNDRFDAMDKALQLQAKAYPTTKDFSDLKTHVDTALAEQSGSSKSVTTLFQALTVFSAVGTALVGYLMYSK